MTQFRMISGQAIIFIYHMTWQIKEFFGGKIILK